MKFSLKFALAVVLGFSLSLLFAAGTGDAKKGKELYAGKCVTCHGDKGEGKPAIEKVLGAKMQPLGSKEVQSMPDDQLQKVMLEGKGKMIPVKLAGSEAANIAAFIRTLAQK
ncbi:MAG: cytochrome c [Acidobacteriota bacterium]